MCTELPNIWKIAAVPLTVLEIKRSRGTRPTDHCTPKLQIYPRTGRHALRQGWHRTCQFFCSPPSDYQHHLQLVCGWRLGQLAPFQAQILDSGLLELSKTGESFFFFSPCHESFLHVLTPSPIYVLKMFPGKFSDTSPGHLLRGIPGQCRIKGIGI